MPLTKESRFLVIGLVVLIAASIPGTPGVGLETRDASGAAWLGIAFSIVGLLILLAIALAWKWPRVSGWLAIAGAAGFALLSILDVARILQPLPPPTSVAVSEVVVAIVALCVVGLGWRALQRNRSSALTS